MLRGAIGTLNELTVITDRRTDRRTMSSVSVVALRAPFSFASARSEAAHHTDPPVRSISAGKLIVSIARKGRGEGGEKKEEERIGSGREERG